MRIFIEDNLQRLIGVIELSGSLKEIEEALVEEDSGAGNKKIVFEIFKNSNSGSRSSF